MQDAFERNKAEYKRLKIEETFHHGEWAVIADGRLHLTTTCKQNALKYLLDNDLEDVYFVQVGDEGRVYEID